ncbi:MAG: hypothetical protein A2Y82_05510 [Candidatus Buchananbacteria bacterium RBG_13_36_9]|uniref:DUF5680 domain-containing protein n=1 Tax=Candidatus Buchananbacteria bacterium RBG_13_36_9 TaxID=1797530 RepID=A0A1G1XPI8_9BACT|nr:MAG: hypothetical protein A2Y82_05510 [Candidatus Buchananbacteria bacterium RBG_13_36_9]
MPDLKQLCKFLVKAKKATYAAGESAPKVIENDNSTTMIFIDGDWKYHDNYFGGEPYGGREVVFYGNKPIYIMTYYGSVNKNITDLKSIYDFLQHALLLIPEDNPFRGPKEYQANGLKYLNEFTGNIDNFSGEEKIYQDQELIYQAKYAGGLVDQRK